MSTVELYKKYRPRKWKGVIGQEKVVTSLRNDVLHDKVPSVYILAGERGCGKTTIAKIMAKAVNCENLQEGAEPCNNCETCNNIDDGTQLGVVYSSMANDGSVDAVRELVREARLVQPVKRQVFILDEVHNIHAKAWDSLLIPFEDPNMKALFILCTTEANKIPKTITSRAPARKLSLVAPTVLRSYIEALCKKEKLDYTDEILDNAIRLGRGSVRDTLTCLQMILETGSAELSYSDRLLDAMAVHDLPECLKLTTEMAENSVNFRDFTEQTFEDLRTLYLIASGVKDPDIVASYPSPDPVAAVKGFMGPKGVLFALHEFGNALTTMATGVDPRILFEIALTKVVTKYASVRKD